MKKRKVMNMSDPRPPLPSRTVNINEWFQERHNAAPPPNEVELATDLAARLNDTWRDQREEAERAGRLEDAAKDCSECGTSRKHYKDDYWCYRCRDGFDAA
jgi:hypothetical protein